MREIYLDNSATTRVSDEAAQAALYAMQTAYGNPSSLHSKGLEAQLLLDGAREQLATAVGCASGEVVFTSGGTEANNLALLGAIEAHRRRGKTVVTTAFEHSSVLEPLQALAERGEITLKLVAPQPDGRVDAVSLADAVDDDTILLSGMLVNSEVGSVVPVAAAAKLAKRKQPRLLVHCDAVQALGKVPVSVAALGVDLLSVSGHKIHAPKGVGALVVRRGVRILPRQRGGHQEKELRAGTQAVPLAHAFGVAAGQAVQNLEKNGSRVRELSEYFVNKAGNIAGLCINSPADATPYICNISLAGVRSETMLHFLAERGIYVSSGSACAGGAASHVLLTMGLPSARVDSALRVSLCARNTRQELDALLEAMQAGMERLAKTK